MNGLHICKIFVKCHVCKNWNSEILSNFQKNSKVNENTITKNCVVDLQFSCCNNMTDNYYFLLRNTFSKMPAAIFFPFAHVLFWSAVVCAAMTELVSTQQCNMQDHCYHSCACAVLISCCVCSHDRAGQQCYRTIVITAAHELFWSAVVCAVMTELVSSAIGLLLSQLRMCCFDQLLCAAMTELVSSAATTILINVAHARFWSAAVVCSHDETGQQYC